MGKRQDHKSQQKALKKRKDRDEKRRQERFAASVRQSHVDDRRRAGPAPRNAEDARGPRVEPQFVPDGPPIDFAHLVEIVRASGYAPLEVGLAAARTAVRHIELLDIAGGGLFTAWNLGALALAGFASGAAPRVQLTDITRIPDALVPRLMPHVYGLTSTQRARAKTRDEINAEAPLTLLRLLGTQSSLQGDPKFRIALPQHLLGSFPLRSGATEAPPPPVPYLDSLFVERYDCTAAEYASMMYALWTSAGKNEALELDRFTSPLRDGARWKSVLARILKDLSCPAEQVAARLNESFGQYEAEALVQGFYADTPLIEVGDGLYVLPPHPFLRLHLTHGLMFRALRLARERATASGSSKPYTNEHSREMGQRFEGAVVTIAKCLKPTWHYGEYEYERKSNAKSPDVILGYGDDVVLVQAKLKQLKPGAFYGYDRGHLEDDARGPLAEMVWRSVRFLSRLDAARAGNRLSEPHAAISERILGAKRIFLLGVGPALPPVFTIGFFRKMVEAGVESSLDESDRAWRDANRGRLAGWHLIDAEELAAFASICPSQSLLEELTRYVSLPGFGYFNKRGYVPAFRDVVVRSRIPRGATRLESPGLASVTSTFEDLSNHVEKSFFPHERPDL